MQSTRAGFIRKVLIANRGEIACRVVRTCEAMGISTVAVCCDSERNAKHTLAATEAVRLGPSPASSSYLRGDVIIDLAKKRGVDAIHPGYGFLSENAEFAAEVTKAGIEFIGPPESAIVAMGSKSESKRLMIAAGVPVVPGYHGEEQGDNFLKAEAAKVGFPLLIKAVSGGGGKGMKIVRSMEEFEDQLHSAQREAVNFFKDPRVILERYIERPRHIECQVFCDKHGNAVFFFERDCSVQRRYQKVLEEAPAPHLSPESRASIGDIAVRAAKAVGYVGAGTVEFIFDTDTNGVYFMEMNTRLQVEHPVTEEVTRIRGQPLDLVRLQIETAAGKPLGFSQEDVTCEGACIEARIFAEAPQRNFLPQCGPLIAMREPTAGVRGDVRVRIDTGFREGDNILVHYDPMIAKLIVWGADRASALRGLRRALDEYHIAGIDTNIDFLKHCCENEVFQKGGVTTAFIAEQKEQLLYESPLSTENVALAAASVFRQLAGQSIPFRLNGTEPSMDFVVNGAGVASESAKGEESDFMQYRYTYNPRNGLYMLTRGGEKLHTIEWLRPANPTRLACLVDGTLRVEWDAVILPNVVVLCRPDGTFRVPIAPVTDRFGSREQKSSTEGTFISPMAGKVTKLAVAEGATVSSGDVVVVLEAMKMEHLVRAPRGGVVRFNVAAGTVAEANAQLGFIDTPAK